MNNHDHIIYPYQGDTLMKSPDIFLYLILGFLVVFDILVFVF